jgi:hypothetical protein
MRFGEVFRVHIDILGALLDEHDRDSVNDGVLATTGIVLANEPFISHQSNARLASGASKNGKQVIRQHGLPPASGS